MTRSDVAAAFGGVLIVALIFAVAASMADTLFQAGDWRDPRWHRERLVSSTFLEHALAYRRDSLTTSAPGLAEIRPGVRLAIDDRLPAVTRDSAVRVIHAQWSRVGSTALPVPVIVALIADTGSVNGVPRVARNRTLSADVSIATPRTGDEPCIIVIRVQQIVVPSSQALRIARQGAVSVCAFFHAFGFPGPHIREWLERVHYDPAGLANWWIPAVAVSRPSRFDEGARYGFDERLDVLKCVAGDLAGCERVPTQKRDIPAMFKLGMRSELEPPPALLTRLPRGNFIGFRGGEQYLSDLVRAHGAEQFGRFWRSTQPVPQAFEEAFGKDFGTAVQDQLISTYGVESRGAAMTAQGAMAALALAALFVGFGVFAAKGWQVR